MVLRELHHVHSQVVERLDLEVHQKYGDKSTQLDAIVASQVDLIRRLPLKNSAEHNAHQSYLHNEREYDSLYCIAQIILCQVHFLGASFVQRSKQH